MLALLLSAQRPAQFHGVVTLTLGGSDEQRDPFIFERVSGLALAPDGRIVVIDGKREQLRLFSAGGALLYVSGQPGQGPGDFQGACCAAFDDQGKLWVEENGNRRYSVLALAAARARFLWSVPMAGQPGYTFDHVIWDRQHHLIDIGQVRVSDRFSYILQHLDSTGRLLAPPDSAHAPPADSLGATWTYRTSGGSSTYRAPFGAAPLYAFGPGGATAQAVSGNYAVRWTDGAGKSAQINVPNATGPLVSAAERAKGDSDLDQIATRNSVSRRTMGLVVPERKPVLEYLWFDESGRLWVERNVAAGAPEMADIYGTGGVLIEQVTWPAGIVLHGGSMSGNTALGVRRDAEGGVQVVRLEFRP